MALQPRRVSGDPNADPLPPKPPRRRTAYQKAVVAVLKQFWEDRPKRMKGEAFNAYQQRVRQADSERLLLPQPRVKFDPCSRKPTLFVYWRGMPPYRKIKDRLRDTPFSALLDRCDDLGLKYKDRAVRVYEYGPGHLQATWITTCVIYIPPAEGEYDVEEETAAPEAQKRPRRVREGGSAPRPADDAGADVRPPDSAA